MKNLYGLFVSILIVFFGYGQKNDSLSEPNYLFLNFVSMGIQQEVRTPINDLISQFFLEKKKNAFYWEYSSIDYIFYKHYGIYLGIGANSITYKKEIVSIAYQKIQDDNPDYYIYDTTTDIDDENKKIFASTSKTFGIVYMKKKKNWYIFYRISLKNFTMNYNYYTAILKEKNTNRYIKTSYEPETDIKYKWTFNPSIGIKYQLSKQAMATLDMSYALYNPRIRYHYRKTDIFSGELLSDEEINCNKNFHQFIIRAGFSFMF